MIVGNMDIINLEKLPVFVPYNLEIVWGLARPKHGPIKQIITAAFYCPPRSRKKTKLIGHICTTIHSLLRKYPGAHVLIGGDRNSLKLNDIISSIPRLLNIQHLPTLNGKNLDVILTTMASYYQMPSVVDPVPCDDPNRGVASDHRVPVVYPLTDYTIDQDREVRSRTTWPLPESGVEAFTRGLEEANWATVMEEDCPTKQEDEFQKILLHNLNLHLPTKTVHFRPQDKPFITKELKKIDRKRKREYRAHGKSSKFIFFKITI